MSDPHLDPLVAGIPEHERRLIQRTDEIAVRVAALMRERGLNQTQLAERVKKSKSYVSRVLSGTLNLTIRTIAEFEAALDGDILTVPAWEPSYPKRRRGTTLAAVPAEVEVHPTAPPVPAEVTVMATAFLDFLRRQIESSALGECRSVDPAAAALATSQLLSKALCGSAGSVKGAAARSVWSAFLYSGLQSWQTHGRLYFGDAHVGSVGAPTGYPSVPRLDARASRLQTCVSPGGELVSAETFTSYESDTDTDGR